MVLKNFKAWLAGSDAKQAPAPPAPETPRGKRILGPFGQDGLISFNTPHPLGETIILMITNECPVGCAHCVTHSGGLLRGDAERSVLQKAVEQITEIPETRTVILQGGDPFASPALLKEAVEAIRARGLNPVITTSAFFATDDDTTRRMLNDLVGQFDELNISVDVFHQRTVPYEYLRRSVRIGQELGLKVAILNCLTREDVEAGREITIDAEKLAAEFNVQIQSWPMLRVGRGNRKNNFAPDLDPNQSCGLIAKPMVLPSGEVHSCCSGAGYFKESHPLHKGRIQQRSMKEITEEISASLFEQGIRVFGPVRLLQLLEENADYVGDQCIACGSLCGLENAKERVEKALREAPELLAKITEYRRLAGDAQPEAHLTANAAVS